MEKDTQHDRNMLGIEGSEGHHLGALTDEQQTNLNKFKIRTRIENEKYLRDHPEVSCLITGFLGSILQQRPGSVREFAASYFSNPELKENVALQVLEVKKKLMRLT
ncbi:RIIa domain-containing protein 1-like [Actinia tenebrosa]|uniref:RIIa domain-containing protein 1-like n=1 Tax=Actinia tenebrosa TaxID=6105 RepID=A0A6P8HFV8_ACTTE|nr:RIIa domain-containing protein 1-like [Actinia tenebrosa]